MGRAGASVLIGLSTDATLRIPNAELITEVSVGTVVQVLAKHIRAVTVRLTVPPSIRYRKAQKAASGPFGGREALRKCHSDGFRGEADLVAVMAAGAFMPSRPEDGAAGGEPSLEFSTDLTHYSVAFIPKIQRRLLGTSLCGLGFTNHSQ